tara:strand:+ start:169 stop:783 length:615 start_codon:yes stop_codon:yes gene_type:complete
MCYSLESSIVTFGIAMATCFFMYKRQSSFDKVLGPYIFCYSLMQLAEAFMWYDTGCGQINIIGGYIAYASLILQVVSMGIGLYFNQNNYYGIILGIAVIIYYLYNMPKMECSKKDKYMKWGFELEYRYIFACCVLLYLFSNISISHRIIMISIYILGYLYFFSKLYGFDKFPYKVKNRNELGSLICQLGSMITPLIYFIPNYIK